MTRACLKCDGPIPEGKRADAKYCSTRCSNAAAKRRERGQPEPDPVLPVEEQPRAKERCTCNPHPIIATDDWGELRCFKCCGPLPADTTPRREEERPHLGILAELGGATCVVVRITGTSITRSIRP
jgi:hypothetical protein